MKSTNTKIDLEVIFVRYVAGTSKKGRDYTAVILANGMEQKFFNTELPESDFDQFTQGDTVRLEMAINPFDDYAKEVLSITSA